MGRNVNEKALVTVKKIFMPIDRSGYKEQNSCICNIVRKSIMGLK